MIQSLYTALTGLKANQLGVDITSNNIANAFNPNYNRTRLIQEERSNINGVGQGVNVVDNERIFDEYTFKSILFHNSNNDSINKQLTTYQQMKNIFEYKNINNENSTTFNELVDSFLDSIEAIQENPTDNGLREVAKINGTNVLTRKNSIMEELNNNLSSLNSQKEELINQSKDLTQTLNKLIKEIGINSKNNNNLLDEIDTIETKLSKIGDFKSFNKTITNNYEDYQYQFDINKNGEVEGINESINFIHNIKNMFQDTTKTLENFIKEGHNNNYDNYQDILKYSYDKNFPLDKNITTTINTQIDATSKQLNTTNNILNAYMDQYNNVTKVNLDEEMTNLIKYQRAYEANAKVIQTSDELLETLLSLKK